MKKTLLFTGILGTSLAASAQITNAGFENWYNNNESTHTYLEPQGWTSIDVLQTMIKNIFGDSTYVVNAVSQTTGAHSGSFAVDMTTAIGSAGDTVAGAVYSDPSGAHLVGGLFGNGTMVGAPFASRPASLNGFYKFNSVGGDSAAAVALFTKWNTATNTRDTIVFTQVVIPGTPSSWTSFSVPLTYLLPSTPDTGLIAFGIISANATHIGTHFFLDDVSVSGWVGINEQQSAVGVTVAPNPCLDQSVFTLGEEVQEASVVIYDMTGKKVKEISGLSGKQFTISRDGLDAGMYMYRIISNGKESASGKLIVE